MSRITFRKCNRRHLFYGISVLLLITLTTHLLCDFTWQDIDNQVKIELIESRIRSNGNSQRCRIPNLPLHTAEIDKFLQHETPLNCTTGKSEDWVRCHMSSCSAQPKKLAEHFQIHCTYVEILRKTDYQVEEPGPGTSITFKSASDQFELIHSDFARIKCKSSKTGERWMGVVIGVRKKLNRPIPSPKSDDQHFNVLMFGFDSLSRNAFMRKLPKSYAYLVDTIGAHVLMGYNIVGDGTPQALIPILTGHTELELPETRKRKSESLSCDVYPMVWKYFERAGYVTAFNEDLPAVGTFTYRLNGFSEQPTDHYMRPYFLVTEALADKYDHLCTGDRPRHRVFMDYTHQILAAAATEEKAPKFIFSFHGELSHDSINLIEVADDDLLIFLQKLNQNFLHNIILIVMSDHGNRFASVRDTLQGKLEERLPFFSFALPDSFKKRFPVAHANLVQNAKESLITPFDINRTLRHIIELTLSGASGGGGSHGKDRTPAPPNPRLPNRALSLFNPIGANRSCADAYIEPHWCSCLQWTPLEQYDNRAIQSAIAITDHINQLTRKFREICAPLQVESIKWAAQMAPSDDLIRFQAASDRDGYLGSFDESRRNVQLYQVKMVTKPGGAIYEASVRHHQSTNEFSVETGHISRVNKYGDQANCIYTREPELRKFCFCKS